MDFVDKFTKDMIVLESVYDLAALCYDYLVENVGDQSDRKSVV